MDEVDRFPASSGTEGDPSQLAEARTTAWSNRKIVLTSTPTDRDASRIERAYLETDQRVYFVPCPHEECGAFQTLKWEMVRWDKDDEGNHLPDTASYYCEECGGSWTEAERHRAVRKGEWRPSTPYNGSAG